MNSDYTSLTIPDGTAAPIMARRYAQKGTLRAIAVVAHPYGPLGGSQSDLVVCCVAQALVSQGISAMTFDFCKSTSFRGFAERQQYLTVVHHALDTFDQGDVPAIYCCGYSYGSLCLPSPEDVMKVKTHPNVDVRYIVISPLLPPISTVLTLSTTDRYAHVRDSTHLAIWGEHDNFTASKRLIKAWPAGVIVPRADHFWHGHLDALKLHITSFIKAGLPDVSP